MLKVGSKKFVPKMFFIYHLHSQMDGEWSVDFAFPLISLLRDNGSKEMVSRRVMEICE